jgi:glucosamine 6-phosphate synthetase-like amidotransferase/phosphosugar isomerase protein
MLTLRAAEPRDRGSTDAEPGISADPALVIMRDCPQQAGCEVGMITGAGGAFKEAPITVLATATQELTPAHTFSYTSALATLAALANGVGRHRSGSAVYDSDLFIQQLPAALKGALETEDTVRELARCRDSKGTVHLAGGGPSPENSCRCVSLPVRHQ